MLRRILTLTAFCMAPLAAQAQSCGASYTVVGGDTAFSIAERVYGDPEKWTLLYYSNEVLFKERVFQIAAGDVLDIPCQPGQDGAATPTPARRDVDLTLVTGSGMAPFADRDWPDNGMVTDLVNAALEATPNPVSHAIVWDDNREAQPDGLDAKTYDMGFPWVKPDCAITPDDRMCRDFHFSDPVVETLSLLFVRPGGGVRFEEDRDLHGRVLCRPQAQPVHDLDRADRQWLSRDIVTLVRTARAEDCFQLLMAGQVDAVAVNVFEGAEAIDALALQGKVFPLERPLATETLHVVISKKHWRGTTHLYRLNAGLQALRDNGRYTEIVARHLDLFWGRLGS